MYLNFDISAISRDFVKDIQYAKYQKFSEIAGEYEFKIIFAPLCLIYRYIFALVGSHHVLFTPYHFKGSYVTIFALLCDFYSWCNQLPSTNFCNVHLPLVLKVTRLLWRHEKQTSNAQTDIAIWEQKNRHKVQIFWEGHKNWKKYPTLFWHY